MSASRAHFGSSCARRHLRRSTRSTERRAARSRFPAARSSSRRTCSASKAGSRGRGAYTWAISKGRLRLAGACRKRPLRRPLADARIRSGRSARGARDEPSHVPSWLLRGSGPRYPTRSLRPTPVVTDTDIALHSLGTDPVVSDACGWRRGSGRGPSPYPGVRGRIDPAPPEDVLLAGEWIAR